MSEPTEPEVAEAIRQYRAAGLGHLADTVADLARQRDKLQSENERLRAALEYLGKWHRTRIDRSPDWDRAFAEAERIAKGQ